MTTDLAEVQDVEEVSLDNLKIRLIEMGRGHEAIPALELAILNLAAELGGESFDLADVTERLRREDQTVVAGWVEQAAADLERTGGVPLTERAWPAPPQEQQRHGPFRAFARDRATGSIPAFRFTGRVRNPTVICSIASGPAYVEMMGAMAVTASYYARLHGYDCLLLPDVRFDTTRPPAWDKVVLIRNLLDQYETVVWMDSDAIVRDPRVDVCEVLDPHAAMHLVAHEYDGMVVPNTGFWVTRRSHRAIEILEAIWDSIQYISHPWWENAALMDLIGFDPEGRGSRPFGPALFASDIRLLDRAWNSIGTDAADEPIIKHYPGRPHAERTIALKMDYGEFLADALSEARALPTNASRVSKASESTATGSQASVLGRRELLPYLLNRRDLTGLAVEVGVQRGLFSEHILERWRGECLISVDPWLEQPDYDDVANVSQTWQEMLYNQTRTRLAPFGQRSQIWRTTSIEAARQFPARTLDFVYLDARHDYASVLEDLDAWFDRVAPGGILAGHDYLDGKLPEGDFGVKAAVDEFFSARGLRVHATRHDGPWRSWIVEIPLDSTGEADPGTTDHRAGEARGERP